MVDVDHLDHVLVLIDLVDNTICTYPRRVKTRQVAPQRFANAVWVIEKRPKDVVQDRNGDLRGEPVNGSPRGSGNDETPG